MLRRTDNGDGCKAPRRHASRRPGDRPARCRGRLSRTRGRVPLRAVPAGRRIRPAPRHGRVAERLEAQPRWTNTHGRPSPGSGELRRPATTKSPSSTSGRERGVLGAGGGPSREISSYRSSSCTKTRWLAGTTGAGSSGSAGAARSCSTSSRSRLFSSSSRRRSLWCLSVSSASSRSRFSAWSVSSRSCSVSSARSRSRLWRAPPVRARELGELCELAFSRSRPAPRSSRSRASASSDSSRPRFSASSASSRSRSVSSARSVLGSPRAPPVRVLGSPRARRARALGARRALTARVRARSALRVRDLGSRPAR